MTQKKAELLPAVQGYSHQDPLIMTNARHRWALKVHHRLRTAGASALRDVALAKSVGMKQGREINPQEIMKQ